MIIRDSGFVATPQMWAQAQPRAYEVAPMGRMGDFPMDRAAYMVAPTMDMAYAGRMREADAAAMQLRAAVPMRNGFEAMGYGAVRDTVPRVAEAYRPIPMAQFVPMDRFNMSVPAVRGMYAAVPSFDRAAGPVMAYGGVVDSRGPGFQIPPDEPVSQCPSLKAPWWEAEALVQFTRNLYVEAENVKAMPTSEVDQYRQRQGIQCYGTAVPKPCRMVADLSCLPEALYKQLLAEAAEPEPLESQVWPVILSGRDLLAVGASARGSKLSFVLPALQHINAQPQLKPGDGPIVLIMCPTREAATAVQSACTHYGHSTGIKNAVVIGGVAKGPQMRDLGKGVEIVIGTPGRLADLLAAGATTLMRVTLVVLDEVDQILELGYRDHVQQMLRCIRPDRQTVLVAREWHPLVQELGQAFCRDGVEVRVGVPDRVAEVRQGFEIVSDEGSKRRLLSPLLDKLLEQRRSCLIFTRASEKADDLTMVLRSCGYPALVLPSRYAPQQPWGGQQISAEFLRVVEEFRQGKSPILVACDAVARGADLPEFHLVVNFDMPQHISEYIERLRRVARASFVGEAFSLLAPTDARLAPEVLTFLEEGRHPIPAVLQEFIARMAGPKGAGPVEGRAQPLTVAAAVNGTDRSGSRPEGKKEKEKEKEREKEKDREKERDGEGDTSHRSASKEKASSRGRKEKRAGSRSKKSKHSKSDKSKPKRTASRSPDPHPPKTQRK